MPPFKPAVRDSAVRLCEDVILAAQGTVQSAFAKCAIWSACAFTKAGRAVARAT